MLVPANAMPAAQRRPGSAAPRPSTASTDPVAEEGRAEAEHGQKREGEPCHCHVSFRQVMSASEPHARSRHAALALERHHANAAGRRGRGGAQAGALRRREGARPRGLRRRGARCRRSIQNPNMSSPFERQSRTAIAGSSAASVAAIARRRGSEQIDASTLFAMRGAVAAGNRHTAEAGAWALAQGGNAVDAVVAAALAAFVAEGPLTGPAGGGFFLLRDAGGEPTLLDCFFAVPSRPQEPMDEVLIDFGDASTQVFHVGAVVGRRSRARRGSRRGARAARAAPVGGAVRAGARARRGRGRDVRRRSGSCSRSSCRSSSGRRRARDLRLARPRGDGDDGSRARAAARPGRGRRGASSMPELAADLAAYRVVERAADRGGVRGDAGRHVPAAVAGRGRRRRRARRDRRPAIARRGHRSPWRSSRLCSRATAARRDSRRSPARPTSR